jgi:hypothetical protein
MAALPNLSNQDDRLLPNYWKVKAVLAQRFGAKLPFERIRAFMQAVRAVHGLIPTRKASREKDFGIGWICRHWDLAEPMLAQIPSLAEEQDSQESKVLGRSWAATCAVQEFFASVPGGKPAFATLVKLAKQLAKAHRLDLQRAQKRNQKLLFAWFAENWTVLGPEVLTSEVFRSQPTEQEAFNPEPVGFPPLPIDPFGVVDAQIDTPKVVGEPIGTLTMPATPCSDPLARIGDDFDLWAEPIPWSVPDGGLDSSSQEFFGSDWMNFLC